MSRFKNSSYKEFAGVTKGFEIITKLENLKVNKLDKPYEIVKIINAEAH